jgi:NTE family protein
MPRRIGLVLAGGGVIGSAYHAGALTALHQDTGWDPRSADVIVGTSAGSLVGALLRLGVEPADLALVTAERNPTTEHPVLELLRARPEFGPLSLRQLLRPPRLPNRQMVAGLLDPRRPTPPMGAAMSLVANGRELLTPLLEPLDELVDHQWPRDDLWVCTVRQSDARRVVFGRSRLDAPLSAALSASCAVPGYFQPVEIEGRWYIDGGAWSASNADVLRDRDLDLVVVVSPMSTRDQRPSWDLPMRRWVRRVLQREVATLRARGIPVIILEPGRDVLAHMALDLMSGASVADIVREAFLDTGSELVRLESEMIAPVHRLRSPARAAAAAS